MKNKLAIFTATLASVFLLSSCSVVSGIFKAGMIWAFFLVGVVIAIILYFVFRSRKS